MPNPLDARQTLDREFLELRAKLLQIGAMLDRLDRADGSVANDPRLAGIRQALEVLQGDAEDRAKQIQLIFSRTYDPAWRTELRVAQGRE
jgi:hypothetical protein